MVETVEEAASLEHLKGDVVWEEDGVDFELSSHGEVEGGGEAVVFLFTLSADIGLDCDWVK